MSGVILRIATRRSRLALAQTRWVASRLRERDPRVAVELVECVTRGDRVLDVALTEVGGKGLFTREIEEALLDGRADLAVHSLKDLPGEQPEGLVLAAVPEREDPRDALALPGGASGDLSAPARGARVGTGSLRRRAQLLHVRPDLRVETIRGNVDTRLRKLDQGEFDALVLAAAGLRRLGLTSRIAAILSPEVCLPAPGQGALGVQCRADDAPVRVRLQALEDPAARESVEAERALLEAVGGGCSVPLGAWARREGGELRLDGVLATEDGSRLIRAGASGDPGSPQELGRRVGAMLREQAATC